MDTVSFSVWLLNNGFSVASFVTLIGWLMKWHRWSGVVDTRLSNLEGWIGKIDERQHSQGDD